MRLIFSTFFLVTTAVPAHAHMGHVGELAGHAHWIALGAAAAAAALAAVLTLVDRDEEDDAEETDQAGEAA